MSQMEALAEQVRHNCDISDARHAGLFSICGLALRLRDLYKWEHDLAPWQERETSEILDWIGAKETLWEKLAGRDYRRLSLNGERFDPFDTRSLNARLNPRGFFYGAGYAHSMKPTFFLTDVRFQTALHGCPVYTLGRELARALKDLLADTAPQGALRHLGKGRQSAGVGFYVAFLGGLAKKLLPELVTCFGEFARTSDWRLIEQAVSAGHQRAQQYTREMVEIYRAGKDSNDLAGAAAEMDSRLLKRLLA